MTEEEQALLKRHYQTSKDGTVRKRSQCLLLSHQGMRIQALSETFGVQRATISRWFNSWETTKALAISCGRGRKKKLSGLDGKLLKEYVTQSSRSLDTGIAQLAQTHGVQISKKTLQRFLKTRAV
ncbi:helix-turn-helix domain-containing protein [Adhaeribacter radiodurans]|uniref:Helix-turn-helix domain-containing protein n=1 Tax=Adhaeribacter radiodurans TaxID=2745197 RepID=A0A7L7LEW3_9BACT|nr:helix-turn-helix domain-containing protein [Adhaeribacter radiodurans]QMU31025.1 helix-turn-helix domain-containing protein [Adhaeribacter radiodurans]